jgi:hypothetical protein
MSAAKSLWGDGSRRPCAYAAGKWLADDRLGRDSDLIRARLVEERCLSSSAGDWDEQKNVPPAVERMRAAVPTLSDHPGTTMTCSDTGNCLARAGHTTDIVSFARAASRGASRGSPWRRGRNSRLQAAATAGREVRARPFLYATAAPAPNPRRGSFGAARKWQKKVCDHEDI